VQRYSRVYRGTWKHNGAAHDVVVKVVSRRQAAHEARVLQAVSGRPEARAIQVLAQVPVNGPNGDVGLVTPYCSGGHLFEGAASVHDVLRQAVQLCEVVTRLWGFTAAALWLTLLLEHGRGWLLLLSLPVLVLVGAVVLVMSAPGGDGMACCRRSAPRHQARQRGHHKSWRCGGA